MHFDFIEIGTSDFRTLIGKNNGVGISIEPIKGYLDNLPEDDNVIKLNCGISNYIGETKIYYVKPDDILKNKLPNWVRGCNSINNPHPTILNLLGDKHDDIITIDIVKIINWEKLINDYNIETIDLLKIDTEGHDAIILKDYYDNCLNNTKLLAKKIIFENNILSDTTLVDNVINLFKNIGYSGKPINNNGQQADYELIKLC